MVIGILKHIRSQLGKSVGDEVTVTLERDDAKREVDVPDELATALKQAGMSEVFAALSFSRRREIVGGVVGAKHPETRQRRIASAIRQLEGKD